MRLGVCSCAPHCAPPHGSAYPTTDLEVAALGDVGAAVRARVEEAVLPALTAAFSRPAGALAVHDLFVAKYEGPAGAGAGKAQAGLGEHEDGTPWSFVIQVKHGQKAAILPQLRTGCLPHNF